MDETEPAAKALELVDASEVAVSDTESEAEVATMTVMGETGNIDIAESLPNPDDAESAFAGQCEHACQLILCFTNMTICA